MEHLRGFPSILSAARCSHGHRLSSVDDRVQGNLHPAMMQTMVPPAAVAGLSATVRINSAERWPMRVGIVEAVLS
jgi:hypothetical protein